VNKAHNTTQKNNKKNGVSYWSHSATGFSLKRLFSESVSRTNNKHNYYYYTAVRNVL